MQPKIVATIVGLVIVGGGVWAFSGGSDEPTGPVVPEDLTVEAIKKQVAEEPTKVFDRMREARRDENLSEDQRRQVGRNMRTVMMGERDKRMDEYFAATDEAAKNAILDRQIDEFQEMRKGWEKRRAEREAARAEKGEDGEKADEGRGPFGRRGSQTRAQRQNRSEGRSPDAMAKRMTYFGAMRARAQSRGIEMGGRGGPGGGHGMRGGR